MIQYQLGLAALFLLGACRTNGPAISIEESFDGGYGQVEVGGPFAGAEFHRSYPLPARISFYYPLANSIDLSTDYWRRYESMPFQLKVALDGRVDTVGREPFVYRATPYAVTFEKDTPEYRTELSYHFGQKHPFVAVKLAIQSHRSDETPFTVDLALRSILHTSHAYTMRDRPALRCLEGKAAYEAVYREPDTGPVTVFVVNGGETPVDCRIGTEPAGPAAGFTYRKTLDRDGTLEIVWLIGTARTGEADTVRESVRTGWVADVEAYETSVLTYARSGAFTGLNNESLDRTARWSRAVLAANRHYLDGRMVPMPCPAEYNFFFTHDLLVTDLGAVLFDTERVRDDLLYLKSLAGPDSTLPHAYYWREDGYKTEPATPDNWNHLWFILTTRAYLAHSGDTATVRDLYPMLQKSLRLMLQNERNGRMYAWRPDWWDIGHVYGPRAYLTALMARALEAYSAVSVGIGQPGNDLPGLLDKSARMKAQLASFFWDEKAGYLLNGLDTASIDRHYYSGSLVAGAFGLIDVEKSKRLVATAREQLLDPALGIRNAVPVDFHRLGDVYRFQGGEAGAPYLYMNGGVWPQGNAWYILALIAAGEPDEALAALERVYTLDGIRNSPRGQPSFYEYRNTDPASAVYGEIDKPTFLWAGGWYMNALYHLAGVRENAWNVFFSPDLPSSFSNPSYEVMLSGRRCRVSWKGDGKYFRRLKADGRPSFSAVVTGPVERLELDRGRPESPYLAEANALVDRVTWDADNRQLAIALRGVPGQVVRLGIVSPTGPVRAEQGDGSLSVQTTASGGAFVMDVTGTLQKRTAVYTLTF